MGAGMSKEGRTPLSREMIEYCEAEAAKRKLKKELIHRQHTAFMLSNSEDDYVTKMQALTETITELPFDGNFLLLNDEGEIYAVATEEVIRSAYKGMADMPYD